MNELYKRNIPMQAIGFSLAVLMVLLPFQEAYAGIFSYVRMTSSRYQQVSGGSMFSGLGKASLGADGLPLAAPPAPFNIKRVAVKNGTQLAALGGADDDWAGFAGVAAKGQRYVVDGCIFFIDTHNARQDCFVDNPDKCNEILVPPQFSRIVVYGSGALKIVGVAYSFSSSYGSSSEGYDYTFLPFVVDLTSTNHLIQFGDWGSFCDFYIRFVE